MSEVFYRKWRPRRLDQVVGQEAVTQTLLNAVRLDRIAHAYLFCGPRGTGKTSTARIVAKAVNCLSPQNGEPDNECEICGAIDEARALDLIEIDAASNRGIDDIRELRERVHFSPNEARYKVYIVDEVHMLTEPAFNALLKTLEEPPAHAIFVLATTEVHKVPLTIISRCQRFDFRRIPLERIVDRLSQLCADEGVEAAPEALAMIARTASGSLRDAENLLEQALVSYGSPLTETQVSDLLDLGSDERALELAEHVVDRAAGEGIKVINQVADEGSDLRQFHRVFIEYLRGIMLLKSGARSALGYPEETLELMGAMAKRCTLDHLVRALKIFSAIELRRDSSLPLPLELAMVESTPELETPGPEAASAQVAPEPRARRGPDNAASPPSRRATTPTPTPTAPRPQIEPPRTTREVAALVERPSSPPPRATPPAAEEPLPTDPSSRLDALWDDIVKLLRTRKGKRFNLGALLRSSIEREVSDDTVTLKYAHASHQERMQEELDDPQSRKILQEALAKALEGSYRIQASMAEGRAKGPRVKVSQQSHLVRSAEAMGARIVDEKEETQDDE